MVCLSWSSKRFVTSILHILFCCNTWHPNIAQPPALSKFPKILPYPFSRLHLLQHPTHKKISLFKPNTFCIP